MIINLDKPHATRLAVRLAHTADDHLSWVYLGADGTLFATDGYGLVISKDAHDAERQLFIRMDKYTRLSTTAERYFIDTDQDKMVEVRPRSRESYDITLSDDEPYPGVYRRIPHHLTEWPKEIPPFDSVRAGRMASDYGLDRGVWLGGPGKDAVHLTGVTEGDYVLLGAVDVQT